MNVAQPDAPHDGLVATVIKIMAVAAPWAQLLINEVQTVRNELQRADLPRMREDIAGIRNDVQNVREMLAAADFPQIKDDIETMRKELRRLPTKSYFSEKLKEELKPLKIEVNGVRKTLDSVKEDITAVAPGRLARTIAFTNKLYIRSTKLSNMMKVHPDNLEQVPAPDGTLPWNTRIGGPDGEEIVLAPLVSLDAIQALGASQLGTYVQLYYPGREVPEDLAERKRLVLLAIGRPRESYEVV